MGNVIYDEIKTGLEVSTTCSPQNLPSARRSEAGLKDLQEVTFAQHRPDFSEVGLGQETSAELTLKPGPPGTSDHTAEASLHICNPQSLSTPRALGQ